ncbi:sulfite reductase [Aliarcobacter lanthieri]|uniref:sulfite reductase n=1 Tax=Aliarcobacter lanthieri TaxID=1355374 RepID=UPI00192482D0|nr:sulfite reductase [Aliarcobacter lanthieri]MBL3520161.1 sulfite reductase [Aliarcobacter lanthieri]
MSSNINLEKLKKEKSSIDILGDIYFYAVFAELIPDEDLERFKWYGIYAQDEEQKLFTLRIPLTLGELNIEQLKALSLISKKFSDDNFNFSKEQKVEFRNIKISSFPDIFNILQDIGLNSFFENGHTIRRVLTCPVNGVDPSQIFDVEDIAKKLNETFVGNRNFSNLPNKLQIAISGYEEGCDVGFLPDVSFNAISNLKDKIVFSINILGKNIGFINSSQIINTTRAIANIYKDYGNRDDIQKSTFEYFIKDLGLNSFCDILESMCDYKLQSNNKIEKSSNPRKARLGINQSAIKDFSFIGCKIEHKSLSSKIIDELVKLLETFGAKRAKITHKSNIIILDVPTKNASVLAKELENIGFNSNI